jgi:hypothetical protein
MFPGPPVTDTSKVVAATAVVPFGAVCPFTAIVCAPAAAVVARQTKSVSND